MPTQISGDNVLVPGQATIQGVPTALDHTVTSRYAGTLRAYVQGLLVNSAAPADLAALTVTSARFVPVRVIVYNPTGNMAAATLGLYTAAGAGGVAIVTPVLLAALTAVDTFQELTIAALASVITATTLYPRLTVASGVAGSVSLMIEFVDLSLI